MSLDAALARISSDRAAALALELVAIPSPTGDTAEVSERFGMQGRGLDARCDYRRPATAAARRLVGSRPLPQAGVPRT